MDGARYGRCWAMTTNLNDDEMPAGHFCARHFYIQFLICSKEALLVHRKSYIPCSL